MITHFLKFPDLATAQATLETAGIYIPPIGNNPGYYRQADISWAFDPIGTISKGGVYDQETGEELVAPTTLDGWHANFAGELPSSLQQFLVHPRSPERVFAGTVIY